MTGRFLIPVGEHPDKCGERHPVQHLPPGARATAKALKKPDWAIGPVRSRWDNLENQLHGKLYQTALRSGATKYRCLYLAESVTQIARGSAVEASCGGRERGMVEQIEELRPELKTDSLSNRRALEHGEIPVVGSGCPECGIDARLSTETPVRRGCKAGGVEPLRNVASARRFATSGHNVRTYVGDAKVGVL